jgi:hypothetical protein
MAISGDNISDETRIQGLLAGFLRSRASSARPAGKHLDHDLLSAFVEGSLNEREAAPALKHLVDCSFCLHVTAELVRLDLAFADEPAAAVQAAPEPSRIADVLNNVLARIFGSRDSSAVFAHNEDDPSKDENADDEPKRSADE